MNGHFQLCRDGLFCHFTSASIRLLMRLLLCLVLPNERRGDFQPSPFRDGRPFPNPLLIQSLTGWEAQTWLCCGLIVPFAGLGCL